MDSRTINNSRNKFAGLDTDQQLDNTTFVQAEPADFRAVVQKLTGSSSDPLVQNNHITLSPHPSIGGMFYTVEFPPMVQERTKRLYPNLAIELKNQNASSLSPGKRAMDASPVSTLDLLSGHGSLEKPVSSVHEERQGFYVHPLGASRKAEPELLNLFPKSSDS